MFMWSGWRDCSRNVAREKATKEEEYVDRGDRPKSVFRIKRMCSKRRPHTPAAGQWFVNVGMFSKKASSVYELVSTPPVAVRVSRCQDSRTEGGRENDDVPISTAIVGSGRRVVIAKGRAGHRR
jgi:hypothetical protein